MTVSVQHLNKTIGSQQILRDVNLAIEEGEVIGLLGPNGAGKSTLMKILVGLWPATNGVVASQPKEKIGYLPENNPLYDDMYIREYLEFMYDLGESGERGRKAARVQEVIEMVGLQPEIGKRIGQLSKGYRQRVGLAQALLHDPKLLVLDEPTTGLDPNQLEDIRALIRRLGEHRTVLLSTHILQEVEHMCTRAIIINHGEIRLDKPVSEIANLETTFRECTL